MNDRSNKTVKIGDLFSMSWGYDQTNVNTFQVTRVTSKGVYVREIGHKSAGGEGFMCQNVTAVKDNFLEESQWCGGYGTNNPETFRRLQWCSNGFYFNFRGRYFAYPTTVTETHYNSWYA